MNKSQLLQSIEIARLNHEIWLADLYPIVKGLRSFKNLSLAKTSSKFGNWLYNDAQSLKEFPSYQELDATYSKIYRILLNLIVILANPTEKTLFNAKERKKEKELTTVYFDQINNLSFNLFKSLYKLEKSLEEELKNTIDVTEETSEPATNSSKKVVNSDINHNAAMRIIRKESINPNATTPKADKETLKLKNTTKKGKKKRTAAEKKDIEDDIKRILGG